MFLSFVSVNRLIPKVELLVACASIDVPTRYTSSSTIRYLSCQFGTHVNRSFQSRFKAFTTTIHFGTAFLSMAVSILLAKTFMSRLLSFPWQMVRTSTTMSFVFTSQNSRLQSN